MDVVKSLRSASLSLRCPELNDKQVVSIICSLILRFNRIETSEAFALIFAKIPEAIEAWKNGIAHNLSSAIYQRGRYVLLTKVTEIRKEKEKAEKYGCDTISLDANTSEDSKSYHELIADPVSLEKELDYNDLFNVILNNVNLTQREKDVFLGLRDGKTLDQIGESFGVSRQAIHQSKSILVEKIHKARKKLLANV